MAPRSGAMTDVTMAIEGKAAGGRVVTAHVGCYVLWFCFGLWLAVGQSSLPTLLARGRAE